MYDKNAPKYINVYNKIKSDIYSGKYAPDSFLPIEDELVRLYSASKTTIRHAISLLRAENILEVRQGIGTRVIRQANDPVPNTRYDNAEKVGIHFLIDDEKNASATSTPPVEDIIPAEIRIAAALNIDVGSSVHRIQRLQMINGDVYSYIVNYISCELAPDFNLAGSHSPLYNVLRDRYNIQFVRAEERITAINAGFIESKFLSVDLGAPLLMLKRTAFSEKGPIDYSETSIRPDLFELNISIGNFRDLYDIEKI